MNRLFRPGWRPSSSWPACPGWGSPSRRRPSTGLRIFAHLSGLSLGEVVSGQALATVLTSPLGGLKAIPAGCQRVVLLTQADSIELQSEGQAIARRLLPVFERVLIASGMQIPAQDHLDGMGLLDGPVAATYTPIAGIILAGGQSRRLAGRPKQLLLWRGEPFVRQVAKTALQAGLSPVVVVTGAVKEGIERALDGLPVSLVHNPDWEQGQSTSIRAGLKSLPRGTGGAVFLLSDQPHIPAMLAAALVEAHRQALPKIVAPEVRRPARQPGPV